MTLFGSLAGFFVLVMVVGTAGSLYDFMTFGEDMSYNNGPMLSKECFDTFLLPYYRRSEANWRGERAARFIVESRSLLLRLWGVVPARMRLSTPVGLDSDT